MRRAAVAALEAAAPEKRIEAVRPLLGDAFLMVRVEAVTLLSSCPLDPEARNLCGRIFKEAFSKEEPIRVWFGGESWGQCKLEQFEPAARAYRRLFPREAFAMLEGILEGIARKGAPGPAPGNEAKKAGGAAVDEDSLDPHDAYRTWPIVIPLYIEWAGIDWDRPFPLEYLGVGDHENASAVLAELKRRKIGAP